MSQVCGGFSASGGTDLNLNEVKSITISRSIAPTAVQSLMEM